MEIVLGIIIIAVIIFVIGGMDNDRPVSEWSDDKLVRMREKLQIAATANLNGGNMNASKKHLDKKQEVEDEIVRREKAFQSKEASKIENNSILPEDDFVITVKALEFAEAGDVKAQVLVGMSYLAGIHGLPKDEMKACKYLLMAAMQDDAHSSFIIAGLYLEGVGIEKNRNKARLWANKAKALGYQNADDMLQLIDSAN